MTYDPKKEVIARSLRMSGAVCFVFLIFSSNKYFEKTSNTLTNTARDPLAFLKLIPGPILASLIISLIFALGAQIWLKKILKAKKELEV